MPWRAAIAIPRTTGTIVAERNGRRVVRNASHPAERRGLTGVPRSADSASKYLRDCASILYESPNKSRHKVDWTREQIDDVARRIARYPFLEGYTFES